MRPVNLLETVTSIGVAFRMIKNVEKKNLEKCTMCIGFEVVPIPFCSAFSFSPVLIGHH